MYQVSNLRFSADGVCKVFAELLSANASRRGCVEMPIRFETGQRRVRLAGQRALESVRLSHFVMPAPENMGRSCWRPSEGFI